MLHWPYKCNINGGTRFQLCRVETEQSHKSWGLIGPKFKMCLKEKMHFFICDKLAYFSLRKSGLIALLSVQRWDGVSTWDPTAVQDNIRLLWVSCTTLTYVVEVKCQVFVLEQGVVGEAGALDLLEEGADIPPVQDIQQHDAGNSQTHVEHRLYTVLQCHGLSLISYRQAELTTGRGFLQWLQCRGREKMNRNKMDA